jgi:DNA protecting protein DprA
MPQTDTTVAVLHLLMSPGVGRRTLNRLLAAASRRHIPVHDLPSMSSHDLASLTKMKPGAAESIRSVPYPAQELSDALEARDIKILVNGSAAYPSRLSLLLGDDAPSVLFLQGKAGLLNAPSAAICGSRKCSETGLVITAQLSQDLASAGVNVVSGYAAGVDMAAHAAALKADGTTTIVLAEGITQFRSKPEVAEALTASNTAIVSEFYPEARWSARNAMLRNATICAFSRAVVLIEAGREGGTFEAGKTALALKVPLFAVEFARPPSSAEGNRYFLDQGAFPIRSNGSGRPTVARVLDEIAANNSNRMPSPSPGLFE